MTSPRSARDNEGRSVAGFLRSLTGLDPAAFKLLKTCIKELEQLAL